MTPQERGNAQRSHAKGKEAERSTPQDRGNGSTQSIKSREYQFLKKEVTLNTTGTEAERADQIKASSP
jgi:hypothetical protein